MVDDFVVRRNDGAYAYNLAVVVDDGAQARRRGRPRRRPPGLHAAPALARATAWACPTCRFAHVPLVLGGDGARLAKRHGAVTLADRREQGEDAAAVRARLAASVGLCAPGERPSPDELVARFDPRRVRPAAVGTAAGPVNG